MLNGEDPSKYQNNIIDDFGENNQIQVKYENSQNTILDNQFRFMLPRALPSLPFRDNLSSNYSPLPPKKQL